MIYFYTGRDNEGYVRLSMNNSPVLYAALTKVQIRIGTQEFDSVLNPAVVQVLEDRVVLALGHAGISAGVYSAQLVVYSVDHTSGIVWADGLNVRIF